MTGLLPATLAVPAAMLLACLSPWVRARALWLLAFAPLPGLAAACFAGDGVALVSDADHFRFGLAIDPPGAMLLGVAALLWSGAGAYAAAYLRDEPGQGRFAVAWLLTLTGSLGVFVAADLASFYLLFALVSLAAWGLVVQDGTARARHAGAVYLVLAVLGEISLLLAFALLHAASPTDSLAIRDVMAALPASPWRDLTIGLLILGFGLKAGLVPLHVWLPLAHPAAPMPASAVLSGAIIKAGIIGLVRFLPFDDGGGWGEALVVIGFVTAFYAVAVGITQANPKTILAYSSVSQMGVVVAVLGLGDVPGAVFYASHHVLAKGALFLGVGVVAACGRRWLWIVLLPVGVLALGFGGLPLTGGALAKLAVKDAFGSGLPALLSYLSAAGTTLLMAHFLGRLRRMADPYAAAVPPFGLVVPWLGIAFAAVAVPWALFPGTVEEAVSPSEILSGSWPVALGLLLAVGLHRWGAALPQLPEGDVLVLARHVAPVLTACGNALERAEAPMQRWSAAGVAMLGLAVALAVSML
ncbi:complex I subunit 5 family protein [Humitalea sp. 24SJ18S-53]|uniref:complex I subunit 5 family protein n=1 Tax=Humitalea sp. 24SJ18S-53 TaxID=3422307 RepID=UPI003D66C30E